MKPRLFPDRLMRTLTGQALAFIIAMAIGAIIILMIDENPVTVFLTLMRGAFGDEEKIAGTLLQTTPILICGIAACIGLRGGMFNIGIEGQLFLGGFAAAWVGFTFDLPPVLHVLAAIALAIRSEEHTSELQSRQSISYAVFCL